MSGVERNGGDTSDGAGASFEESLARIEAVVHDLEDGKIGLAEALERYEEGVKLLRQCYGLLEKAERRIELLTGVDAAGNPVTRPFDDTATVERQSGGNGEDAEANVSRSRKRTARPPKPGETPPEVPGQIELPGSLF